MVLIVLKDAPRATAEQIATIVNLQETVVKVILEIAVEMVWLKLWATVKEEVYPFRNGV